MFRVFRTVSGHLQNPMVFSHGHQKWIHSRNKKAMEFVAKGWSALQEVERVIDDSDLNDHRLIHQLRTAKENFELALEVDNSNTHARYWLSRLHFKYQNHAPGACPAIGAALLEEAADMGDADALYEVGCQLRIKDELGNSSQKAFYYIEKAVDQLHPGALYLLGAVHLAGDCVRKDVASAMWCFHRASEKGHAGAAIAYGSLLLKGAEIPETISKFNTWKGRIGSRRRKAELPWEERVQMAMDQFAVAAKAGCELGLRWLSRLEEEEKMRLLEGSTGKRQDSLPLPT